MIFDAAAKCRLTDIIFIFFKIYLDYSLLFYQIENTSNVTDIILILPDSRTFICKAFSPILFDA
jgi:hypothetical protein